MIQYSEKKLGEIYENIPTWEDGKWTLTSFDSREEFAKILF